VAVHQDLLQKELVLDSIVGGHKDIEEALIPVVNELLSDLLVPLLELVRFGIDTLLINVDFGDEISLVLSHLLLEVDTELVAVIIMHVGADGPDDTKGNVVVDNAISIGVWSIKLDNLLVEENVDEAQAGSNQVADLSLNS